MSARRHINRDPINGMYRATFYLYNRVDRQMDAGDISAVRILSALANFLWSLHVLELDAARMSAETEESQHDCGV